MTTELEKEQLIQHVIELANKVYRALRPIVPQEWLSVDLTMVQLKVLILLFTDGSTRVGNLASALGVSLASATGITDRLVQHGLIARGDDPEDRRAVVCSLSEKGREMVTRLWESGQTKSRSLLERIALPKLQIINKAIEIILDAAGTMEQDVHPVGDAIKSE